MQLIIQTKTRKIAKTRDSIRARMSSCVHVIGVKRCATFLMCFSACSRDEAHQKREREAKPSLCLESPQLHGGEDSGNTPTLRTHQGKESTLCKSQVNSGPRVRGDHLYGDPGRKCPIGILERLCSANPRGLTEMCDGGWVCGKRAEAAPECLFDELFAG